MFAVIGVVWLSESLKLLFASSASPMFKQISAFLFPSSKAFAGSIASSIDGFECFGMWICRRDDFSVRTLFGVYSRYVLVRR